MRKSLPFLLALGVATISLSSCSRSNYSFDNTVPAYLGSEKIHSSTPVAAVDNVVPNTTLAAAPTTQTHRTARHTAQPAAAHAVVKTEAAVVAAPKQQLTKLERKAFKKELKRQLAAAPHETKAEGKSQLTALLLSFFLGGLGIHRFYLGYTGLGILELLTFGVFGILSLIDFIRIILGDLKPKDGEYAKKL